MTATQEHPTTATAAAARPSAGEPIMLAPGDGSVIHPLGLDMCVKAGGAKTAGGLSVIEWTVAPGTVTPPAIHDEDDEAFYVLDGEFTIGVGERKFRATAGSFVYVPRGILHDIACEGASTARVLMIFTPGRMDAFFSQLAALPPGPPNMATVAGLAHEYDTRVFPPSR